MGKGCSEIVIRIGIISAVVIWLTLLFSLSANDASASAEITQGGSLLQGPPAVETPVWTDDAFPPPSEASPTEIPPRTTAFDGPEDHDIVNVMLLGSDTENPVNAGRTDAIMVALINRTAGTVSLLSLPRDLYVYIPGWRMQRINTAFGYGENSDIEGGGYRLLEDTIRYNFGLRIDFYARVDFVDFKYIIDALGGVDVTVDCALQDWRLIDDTLDPQLEESWELYTLPVGVQRLDGNTALWYARSRRTSSDFDRGRRQQDLIRAIWHRVQELGLLNQVAALWGQVVETVETDMTLADVLGLAPMALNLDASQIAHYALQPNVDVRGWRTPNGESVQLPVQENVEAIMRNFMLPPTANRLGGDNPLVEVVNAGGYTGLDQVIANRLAWEGFAAVPAGSSGEYQQQTVLYDFTGQTKGGVLDELIEALRLSADNVVVQPDADRTSDYRVVLGSAYRSCIYNVMPPVEAPVTADATS